MKSLVLVLGLAFPATLGAQSSDSLRARLDLAMALLQDVRAVDLTVGRPSGPFTSAHVPRQAAVLGTSGTTLVLSFPVASTAARELTWQHLLNLGMKPSPPPPYAREGFVFDITPATGAEALCGIDSASYYVRSRPRQGGSLVLVQQQGAWSGSACRPMGRGRSPWEEEAEARRAVEMPLLTAPEGARTQGGPGEGGTSSRGEQYRVARTEVQSSLAAVALVDHYSQQMKTQGWTVGEVLANIDAAVVSATKVSSKGTPMRASLTGVKHGLTSHFLVMHVAASAPPRDR